MFFLYFLINHKTLFPSLLIKKCNDQTKDVFFISSYVNHIPANIELFKTNTRNTRKGVKRFKINNKLERRQ